MGPLQGITIIELQGIGPGPFCGMMLSDMGAEVIRIDRAGNVSGGDPATPPVDVLARGRKSIAVDLKNPDGVETVLRLIEGADGLIEGFRPGVMERLGLGPQECLARNPRLVFGRMTGWGQEGPYAMAAGHDINYIALAGALEPIGRNGGAPVPPLNLVGDFGGGGMLLAFGMACGLLESARSGQGQVVDAAMVDGAATLMAMFHSMRAMGVWNDERGTNLLDTGSHFYDVYECSDGLYISLGSIEPQFYAELMRLTGLEGDEEFKAQMSRDQWPTSRLASPRFSNRRPATSGARSWMGPTSVSHPYSHLRRHRSTRTTCIGTSFPRLPASPSPVLHRDSAGPRRRSRAPHPMSALIPTPCWPQLVSTLMTSPNSATLGPLPRWLPQSSSTLIPTTRHWPLAAP